MKKIKKKIKSKKIKPIINQNTTIPNHNSLKLSYLNVACGFFFFFVFFFLFLFLFLFLPQISFSVSPPPFFPFLLSSFFFFFFLPLSWCLAFLNSLYLLILLKPKPKLKCLKLLSQINWSLSLAFFFVVGFCAYGVANLPWWGGGHVFVGIGVVEVWVCWSMIDAKLQVHSIVVF